MNAYEVLTLRGSWRGSLETTLYWVGTKVYKKPVWSMIVLVSLMQIIRQSLMRLDLLCKQISIHLAILGENELDFREKNYASVTLL